MIWDDTKVETVRYLITEEKLSAKAVAKKFGCSRNAICGVIFRENIQAARAPGWQPRVYPMSKPKTKPTPIRDAKAIDEPVAIGPLNAFPEAANACRWIAGDPHKPGWQCCGHPSKSGPWCDHHRLRLHQKGNSSGGFALAPLTVLVAARG